MYIQSRDNNIVDGLDVGYKRRGRVKNHLKVLAWPSGRIKCHPLGRGQLKC